MADFFTAGRAGDRRVGPDRTLEAIHQLEAALGAAGPGREERWRKEALIALGLLDEATTEEDENAALGRQH